MKPFRAAFWSLLVFGSILGTALVFHPDTPLPSGWNPTKPLVVADPVTPLTNWKLNRTVAKPSLCLAALNDAASVTSAPTYYAANESCFIQTPVDLARIGNARMSGVQTDCPTALRLAMWERHDLQPAAKSTFGTTVTNINDIGSYNCRAMRTSSGAVTRMSSHATASAIDIAGFQFSDGRSLRLSRDWDGTENAARFLRLVRNGACRWFPVTLSPDYNDLHSDHFHLQGTGWGICR